MHWLIWKPKWWVCFYLFDLFFRITNISFSGLTKMVTPI
jgi:hypothetical protein